MRPLACARRAVSARRSEPLRGFGGQVSVRGYAFLNRDELDRLKDDEEAALEMRARPTLRARSALCCSLSAARALRRPADTPSRRTSGGGPAG